MKVTMTIQVTDVDDEEWMQDAETSTTIEGEVHHLRYNVSWNGIGRTQAIRAIEKAMGYDTGASTD